MLTNPVKLFHAFELAGSVAGLFIAIMVCCFGLGMVAFLIWLKWPEISQRIYNVVTNTMALVVILCSLVGVYFYGLVASRRRAVGRYWQ